MAVVWLTPTSSAAVPGFEVLNETTLLAARGPVAPVSHKANMCN